MKHFTCLRRCSSMHRHRLLQPLRSNGYPRLGTHSNPFRLPKYSQGQLNLRHFAACPSPIIDTKIHTLTGSSPWPTVRRHGGLGQNIGLRLYGSKRQPKQSAKHKLPPTYPRLKHTHVGKRLAKLKMWEMGLKGPDFRRDSSYQIRASYNLAETRSSETRTIYVPGAPPVWENLGYTPEETGPVKLPPGLSSQPQDFAELVALKWDVPLRALEFVRPEFDLNEVEVVADAECLAKLFYFCGSGIKSLRYWVASLVGNTLVITPSSLDFYGTGPTEHTNRKRLQNIFSEWPSSMADSVEHRRFYQYNIAGVKCLVLSEIDAVLTKAMGSKGLLLSDRDAETPENEEDSWPQLDELLDTEIAEVEISEHVTNAPKRLATTLRGALKSLNTTMKFLNNDDGNDDLEVIPMGGINNKPAITCKLSIGDAPTGTDPVRTWFARTSYSVLGHAKEAGGKVTGVHTFKSKHEEWFAQKDTQKAMSKLGGLMKKLRELASATKDKHILFVPLGGAYAVLNVFSLDNLNEASPASDEGANVSVEPSGADTS